MPSGPARRWAQQLAIHVRGVTKGRVGGELERGLVKAMGRGCSGFRGADEQDVLRNVPPGMWVGARQPADTEPGVTIDPQAHLDSHTRPGSPGASTGSNPCR